MTVDSTRSPSPITSRGTSAQSSDTATGTTTAAALVGHSVLLMRRHRYTRKISYFRA